MKEYKNIKFLKFSSHLILFMKFSQWKQNRGHLHTQTHAHLYIKQAVNAAREDN
jgi:hypothetical protein